MYDDGKTLTLLTDGDSDLISKQFSVCTSDNYLLVSEYNKETMKGKMYLRYKDQKLKDYDLSECYPVYSWLKEGKNGFYTLMSKNDGSYKTYLYWITKDGAMRELMQVNIKNDLSPQIYFLDARFLIYLDESSYLHRAILDEEKIIQDEILLPEAVKSLETRSYNDGSAVVIKGENSYTYLLRNGESPLLSFGMFSNIACMSEDGKKAYWVLESGILRECDLISAENSNPEYYHVSGVMDSGKEISTYIVDSESLTSGLIKGVDPNAFIFRKLESDNAHYGYYYYDGSTASLLTEVAHDGVLD